MEQRLNDMIRLGMFFNANEQCFYGRGVYEDFNVSYSELIADTDQEWNKKINDLEEEKLKREYFSIDSKKYFERTLDMLELAIMRARDSYHAEKETVDWYNNNMPGVGQKVDYKTASPLAGWIESAEKLVKEIRGQLAKTLDERLREDINRKTIVISSPETGQKPGGTDQDSGSKISP